MIHGLGGKADLSQEQLAGGRSSNPPAYHFC